jgi:hypothetical protein
VVVGSFGGRGKEEKNLLESLYSNGYESCISPISLKAKCYYCDCPSHMDDGDLMEANRLEENGISQNGVDNSQEATGQL